MYKNRRVNIDCRNDSLKINDKYRKIVKFNHKNMGIIFMLSASTNDNKEISKVIHLKDMTNLDKLYRSTIN